MPRMNENVFFLLLKMRNLFSSQTCDRFLEGKMEAKTHPIETSSSSQTSRYTLPKTNMTQHLKMDGWKTIRLPFGARPFFRCELLGSGRVSKQKNVGSWKNATPQKKLRCPLKRTTSKRKIVFETSFFWGSMLDWFNSKNNIVHLDMDKKLKD